MSTPEKDERIAEVESLNEKIANTEETSDENLGEVSGGTCPQLQSCGVYIESSGPVES